MPTQNPAVANCPAPIVSPRNSRQLAGLGLLSLLILLLQQLPARAADDPSVLAGSRLHGATTREMTGTSPVAPALVLSPAMAQSDTDLWQRIRRGFAMEPLGSALVETNEQWYAARQDYIKRFVERGSKYLYHIVEEVERRGMPTETVLLPIIESAFNPQAYSIANAAGMWQFIPSTGRSFGLKQDWQTDGRRDILMSTDAALDYLQKLYGMFNSWELAFAAYNCGEGCVARAIAANQRKGLPTDYLNLKLPTETRNYVPKLIAVKNIVLSPGSYGIELDNLQNRPYFAKVAAPDKIDMKLAARLAEMPPEEFAALNPAFSKPVAAGSGYFLVPTDKAAPFSENLDLYRSLNGPMVSWQTATAKRGESVDKVAKRHGLTPGYLRASNGPFKERKGKLLQPITFMVPMQKEAKIIDATLDMKLAMRPVAATESTLSMAHASVDAAVLAPNRDRGDAPVPAALPVVLPAAMSVAISAVPAIFAAEPAPAANPPSYEVQKGDTLFAIAKRFNLGTEQLQALNALDGNGLQVGQVLLLDGVPAMPAPLRAAASPFRRVSTGNPDPETRPRVASRPPAPSTYIVRAGDTLFAIAQKTGVAVNNLLRWNKLTANSVIQPGAKLRLS